MKSECLDSVLEIVLLNAKSLLQRDPGVSSEAGIVVVVFPYNEDTVILLGILSVMQGIVESVLQYFSGEMFIWVFLSTGEVLFSACVLPFSQVHCIELRRGAIVDSVFHSPYDALVLQGNLIFLSCITLWVLCSSVLIKRRLDIGGYFCQRMLHYMSNFLNACVLEFLFRLTMYQFKSTQPILIVW
jgi:hypothetical protein